jgi:hypothetical protein
MAAFLIILGLVVLFALAPFAGVDSRIQNERDRRGWLPTGRSSS